MQVVRQVNVSYQDQSVEYLNELEYINGLVFANVYLTDTVVVINPEDGNVISLIDLSGLRPEKIFRSKVKCSTASHMTRSTTGFTLLAKTGSTSTRSGYYPKARSLRLRLNNLLAQHVEAHLF